MPGGELVSYAWQRTAARKSVIRDTGIAVLTVVLTLAGQRARGSTTTVDVVIAGIAGCGAFVVLFLVEFVWQLILAPYRVVVNENNRLLFRTAELENQLGARITNQQRCQAIRGLVNVYYTWKGLPSRPIIPEYPLEQLRDDIRTLDFVVDAMFTQPGLSSDLHADYKRAIVVPSSHTMFADSITNEHEELRYVARQKIRRLKRIIVKLQYRVERSAE